MSTHTNLEKKYQKKTPLEHVLDLPDTYIGSVDKSNTELWIYNNEEKKMEKKTASIVHGFFKIFDEILVNAVDHHIRLKNIPKKNKVHNVTIIKVNINKEKEEITIYNNGEGIPIAIHPEHKIYIPEMIFGHLLTSGNYDKDEKKIVGGKNGYGAKLANIFSKKFTLETVDAITGKKYIQVFTNNMKEKGQAKITNAPLKQPYMKVEPYTKITFQPDLERFSLTEFNDDIIGLFSKRVYDAAACTDNTVSVHLNNKKIECKQFDKYADMFIQGNVKKVHEVINERWEIVVTLSPDEELEHMSFVNGIYTYKGGTHVDYVATHIARKLQNYVKKSKKKLTLKQENLKKNMWLFIRATIENPSFNSQTKEFLTTDPSKYDSTNQFKLNVSDKFIEKLAKTGIIERTIALEKHKDDINLSKTDGKKIGRLKIPNLDDAELAGTKRSNECTLILTEGLSAMATAVAGVSVVGRDKFGVFPLKGKLLNVREATVKQLATNEEINNLKKILGLQQYEGNNKSKKVYKDVNELRYGRIMIFTDSDYDGSHIKGLVMNLIHTYWQSLIDIPGFITSLATPIVKITKGKQSKAFYTLSDFKDWRNGNKSKGWSIKYYKGLGTSSSVEAKDYFRNFEIDLIKYENSGEECNEAMLLAFEKSKTNKRKD